MSGTISDNIDKQSGVIAEPAGGVDVESSDPAASEGTVWFNTTSGVLKVYRTAWATVNSLNTGVYANIGAGTESAGLSFGGRTSASNTVTKTLGAADNIVDGVIADGDILDSVSIKVSCFKSDRFAANLGMRISKTA